MRYIYLIRYRLDDPDDLVAPPPEFPLDDELPLDIEDPLLLLGGGLCETPLLDDLDGVEDAGGVEFLCGADSVRLDDAGGVVDVLVPIVGLVVEVRVPFGAVEVRVPLLGEPTVALLLSVVFLEPIVERVVPSGVLETPIRVPVVVLDELTPSVLRLEALLVPVTIRPLPSRLTILVDLTLALRARVLNRSLETDLSDTCEDLLI